MIRYFELAAGGVFYFNLRDLATLLIANKRAASTAEWNAQQGLVQQLCADLKFGHRELGGFYIVPGPEPAVREEWWVHWVRGSYVKKHFAKSSHPALHEIFSLIDYRAGAKEQLHRYFQPTSAPQAARDTVGTNQPSPC